MYKNNLGIFGFDDFLIAAAGVYTDRKAANSARVSSWREAQELNKSRAGEYLDYVAAKNAAAELDEIKKETEKINFDSAAEKKTSSGIVVVAVVAAAVAAVAAVAL